MSADVAWAANEIKALCDAATPGPWTVGVSPNRFGAMVCPAPRLKRRTGCGWEWDDFYGGCLVAESVMPDDRDLLIAMRNAAPYLSLLLGALADEDPIEAGRHARSLADAVYRTNIAHPNDSFEQVQA